jgi:hypothetical protein
MSRTTNSAEMADSQEKQPKDVPEVSEIDEDEYPGSLRLTVILIALGFSIFLVGLFSLVPVSQN